MKGDELLVVELRAAYDAAPMRPVDPVAALAGGRRRRRSLAALRTVATTATAAAVVLGAVWIGGRSADPSRPVVAVAPEGTGDPASLVNVWHVSGAPGIRGDALLEIDVGTFRVLRDCGEQTGVWDANGAAIVATTVASEAGACADANDVTSWVDTWAQYEADVAAETPWVVLRDAEGMAVATMTQIPWSAIYFEAQNRPTVEAAEQARMAPPAPLPEDVRAAEPWELVGRWVPAVGRLGAAGGHLDLTSDGWWSGQVNCRAQGSSGRWALDESGWLLGVERQPLEVTASECPTAAGHFAEASRVGMRGNELVLFDREGRELARLVLAG